MKRIAAVMVSLLLMTSCSKQAEKSQTSSMVADLKTETLEATEQDDYYEAVGTVRAKKTSVIASKILGNIVSLRVREGDAVRAGQVLVEIENRDAGIQLQKTRAGVRETQDSLEEVDRSIRAAESARTSAQANETLAGKTFNRYEVLFERRSVSPQEFDEVRAKYEVAKAETERADRMLDVVKARRAQVQARIEQAKADVANAQVYVSYSRIASPIDGVVVSRQSEVGSMAMPGVPLLTIEDNSTYQLEAAVEESQLGRIRLHDRVNVILEALGAKDIEGRVDEIVPAADPATRSYIVKIVLPNISGWQVRTGLYGKARFVLGQRKILAIPQASVVQQGQLTGVFVVDQAGFARLRFVKTGKSFGEHLEVLSGLSNGERIVSEVPASLKDGTRVRDANKTS